MRVFHTDLSTRTRAALECGIGSNFCLGAPGRMPGPRGACIAQVFGDSQLGYPRCAPVLPAACDSQVSREMIAVGHDFVLTKMFP